MERFFLNFITRWALLGGVILIFIMVMTSLNAFGFALDRLASLFGYHVSGLAGYEDVVRLTIACATIMFFPYCQLHRGHIIVDVFTANLSLKYKQILDKIYHIILIFFSLFLAYWMIIGMVENISDNALSPILGLSLMAILSPCNYLAHIMVLGVALSIMRT